MLHHTALDAEWVRLTNTRTYSINLKGWMLRDKANHIYTFASDYSLGAGNRAYIHTGKGTNGSPDYQHRYQGRAWYVWNNTGDTVYVRNPSGTLIDSCSWGQHRQLHLLLTTDGTKALGRSMQPCRSRRLVDEPASRGAVLAVASGLGSFLALTRSAMSTPASARIRRSVRTRRPLPFA